MRAIGYGAVDAREYVTEKSFEMCRFVQIEHTDAIDSLEEIVQIPYIDGFIFGPNDLSGSLGEFLHVFGETTLSRIQYAADILRKHNKCFGIAGGMGDADLKAWSAFSKHTRSEESVV